MIADNEILYKYPIVVSDGTTNGGPMSNNAISSGSVAALFDNIFLAERLAGSTKRRKVCVNVANALNETLVGAFVFLFGIPAGDDYVLMHLATHTDTQNDIIASPVMYGCAVISENLNSGVSVIKVNVENAAQASGVKAMFRNGDKILISNKATPSAGTGTTEEFTINGALTVNGLNVQFPINGTLANSYTTAQNAIVSSMMSLGDIAPAISNYNKSSTAGTTDTSTYPVIPNSIGALNDHIRCTFTSATEFTCVGTRLGTLGYGVIGSDFSPANSVLSSIYFTIESELWGGTWAPNDYFEFDLTPCEKSVWIDRIIPTNSSNVASANIYLCAKGESA